MVPAVAGDIGDPRSIVKARLGSLGLLNGAAAGPAGSKSEAGLGMSRSPSGWLFSIPCGPSGPSIVHVVKYCSFTVGLHFSGESLCYHGKLEKNA